MEINIRLKTEYFLLKHAKHILAFRGPMKILKAGISEIVNGLSMCFVFLDDSMY